MSENEYTNLIRIDNFQDLTLECDYFNIITLEKDTNRKTPIYKILTDTTELGEIKWFSNWRRFCFFPYEGTVWDYICLNDVQKILEILNLVYKLYKKENENKVNKVL